MIALGWEFLAEDKLPQPRSVYWFGVCEKSVKLSKRAREARLTELSAQAVEERKANTKTNKLNAKADWREWSGSDGYLTRQAVRQAV